MPLLGPRGERGEVGSSPWDHPPPSQPQLALGCGRWGWNAESCATQNQSGKVLGQGGRLETKNSAYEASSKGAHCLPRGVNIFILGRKRNKRTFGGLQKAAAHPLLTGEGSHAGAQFEPQGHYLHKRKVTETSHERVPGSGFHLSVHTSV